jgi:hypothetical protein
LSTRIPLAHDKPLAASSNGLLPSGERADLLDFTNDVDALAALDARDGPVNAPCLSAETALSTAAMERRMPRQP